jgi:mannose/cellobiose epimerase-like protein (N-acyl-D-glucosamine 2-epimerase family)
VFHYYDPRDRAWGPDARYRDPQQLAYALLGISFYYYLTRDAEALPDIVDTHDYIMRNYFDPELGALRWLLEDKGNEQADQLRLTAQLDQLNAYMVLVTPLLPAERRTQWERTMLNLARIIQTRFYVAEDNLVFLKAGAPDDIGTANAETDFGHTVKSFWMMRFVARQTGDAALQRFAETNALRVLERAFVRESGSWARGVQKGGAIDTGKEWWIYNELDQYAASIAIQGPDAATARAYLDKTNPWYMRHFVDATDGEVWSRLTPDGARAPDSLPKKWPWKSAYHSVEHALVGYVTSQAIDGKPLTLYYGFAERPDTATVRPYFFRGALTSLDNAGGVWKATFSGVD